MEHTPLDEQHPAPSGQMISNPKKKESHWLKELKDWIKTLGISFIIVLFVHQFIFNISIVQGHSMEPTLEDEERLFVNKVIYWLGSPNRGDVVILKDPRPIPDEQYLVKRIVGMPGDTVEIRADRLYINGALYDEPYTSDAPIIHGSYGPIVVPEGYYYVLGDNRGRSTDSRDFGVVPKDYIKGRAEFILWPVSKIGGL